MPDMSGETVSRKTYLTVFGWLAYLTLLEIGGAASGIPRLALVIFLVASALSKAFLIVLYFMHLKFESHWVWILPAIPLAFAIFFVAMLFPDIVYHLTYVFEASP